jgi:hypothetical protein
MRFRGNVRLYRRFGNAVLHLHRHGYRNVVRFNKAEQRRSRVNRRQHRSVGVQDRYRRKARFNLIDRESIIVVNLESPQLLLVYVIFWFRSEEMTKGVLEEVLLKIRKDRVQRFFVGISFKLGEPVQSVLDVVALQVGRRIDKVRENVLVRRPSRNKMLDCTPVFKEMMSLDKVRNPRR